MVQRMLIGAYFATNEDPVEQYQWEISLLFIDTHIDG